MSTNIAVLPREERLDNCIEWLIDLLESNFAQAEGELAYGGARCCLGVGNQVAHEDLHRTEGKYDPHKGLPTDEEAQNFGLQGDSPQIYGTYLTAMNDDGIAHPEIARAILRSPEQVLSEDIVDDVKAYFTFGEY